MKTILLTSLSLITLGWGSAQAQSENEDVKKKAALIESFNKSCKESMVQAGLEEEKYAIACDCISKKVNDTYTLEQLQKFSFDALDKAETNIQTTIQQFAMECVAAQ